MRAYNPCCIRFKACRMSAFRMLLCGAGLAVFLVVRYYCASSQDVEADVQGNDASHSATKTSMPPAKATNPQPVEKPPAITHLELRNHHVTIKQGADGPVYEVRSKDGKVLAKDLSDQELHARHPGLHRLIETAIASNTAKDGRVLDARVTHTVPSESPPAPSSRPR